MNGKSSGDWDQLAVLIAASAEAGEKAEADVFMAAWLGEEDVNDYNDVLNNKDSRALVFPGVVFGYASEDDALKRQSPKEEKKQKL